MNIPSACSLCPRRCMVDRASGERGFCGAGLLPKVARAALHYWEEPCISGEAGSGAVFFSGCTLRCLFCQNRAISRGEAGLEVPVERLAEIFLELQQKGAENINLVTPTHYTPQIMEALAISRAGGLSLPIVWNVGGWELPETVALAAPCADIWLTDFKYFDDALALEYSGARDYFSLASAALAQMVEQTGSPLFDERGMMLRGVIVRHLMLPGHQEDSLAVLRFLHERFGDKIWISLMNQYTPMEPLLNHPELSSTVSDADYDLAIEFALSLGIENAFIQEGGTVGESFIPPFDCEGV